MICPKCNSKYKSQLNFCPRCGNLFNSIVVDEFAEKYSSYDIEQYIQNNFESNGNPKDEYFLFGWFYSISKKMIRTTIYLLLWFLFILYCIKEWGGVILLFIRLYPFSGPILVLLVVLFVKYHPLLLSKLLNNDIMSKYRKLLNDSKDCSKEDIIKKITEENNIDYKLLTLSIIVSIILILFIFFIK
ncbi:MAG: hypothetical protein IKQ35_02995 [Bacilli bacterium]|nr:hypothetical protein [Bacilli bacterium]